MTALLDFLRQRLWTIAFGAGLAGALLLLLGPKGVWALLLLILATAVIFRLFVPAPRQLQSVPVPASDEGILSPLVRRVLGQMPVPLMLLDGGSRVLFVNAPMRGWTRRAYSPSRRGAFASRRATAPMPAPGWPI